MNISYVNQVPKDHELLCIICNETFKNGHERNRHIKEIHNLTYEQYIIKYYFNKEYPVCKCGCETPMKFIDSPFGIWFKDYTSNHFPRKKHTEESKRQIGESCKKHFIEKYGVDNPRKAKIVKDKIKQVKLEKYGSETYNNSEKNKKTLFDRYGVDNAKYLAKKIKHSNIELELKSRLSGSSIIINDKCYDIVVGNNVFEIDGDWYHPKKISELSITQLNNVINDEIKIRNIPGTIYELYHIYISNLPDEITVNNLITHSYIPDHTISYYHPIVTKKYLTKYKTNNGNKKIEQYIKCTFLKFVRTFQPTFPYPPLVEQPSDIINKLQTVDVDNIFVDGIFHTTRCSNIGNKYIKSVFNSYWNSSFNGQKTPVEAWLDDKIMYDVIKYRIGCNDSNEVFDFSLHQLIRGLSARRFTISFFRPSLAYTIYKTLLGNVLNPIVLDPCCGFGARMIGFKAAYPDGTYIGCEPNIDTYTELLQTIQDFNFSNVVIHNCKFEDFVSVDSFDCVFTSIPYFDKEMYSQQVSYTGFEEWVDKFIHKFYEFKNVYINMDQQLCTHLELESNIKYYIQFNTSHFNKQSSKKEVIVHLP